MYLGLVQPYGIDEYIIHDPVFRNKKLFKKI